MWERVILLLLPLLAQPETMEYRHMEVGSFNQHPRRTLIGFDITSLGGQFAAINSVTLRLYENSSSFPADGPLSALTVDVFAMSAANGDWTEVGADASTKDGVNPWAGSLAAGTSGTDYLTPAIATSSIVPVGDGTAVDFVFTDLSFITSWSTGNNNGLLLRAQTEQDSRWFGFWTSEGPQATRPELIVDFTPIPEPTALVVWSMLGTLGLSYFRRRRRRAA